MAETLDSAREEAMNLFEEQTIDDAEVVEDTTADETSEEVEEDTPVDEVPAVSEESTEEVSAEQQAAADAANTAQIAAETAAAKDAELQQALEAMKQMQEQNAQLQEQISELSKVNEQHLIEETMQMPTLDVNGLAFADEATVKAAQEKYAQDMAEYIKQPLMKELSPFIEQAKEGQRIKQRDEIVEALNRFTRVNKRVKAPTVEEFKKMLEEAADIISKQEEQGIVAISENHDNYPKKLLLIDDAPLLLFAKGRSDDLSQSVECSPRQ